MSNLELVSAHYLAGARGDLSAMMAGFDARITWIEARGFPLAGEYHGTNEVRDRVFAAIAEEWEGFGMRVDELFECGDTVIALGQYCGTHRITGRELDARTVHIWRLSGNRIIGFEQITDTLLVAQAAGQGEEAA